MSARTTPLIETPYFFLKAREKNANGVKNGKDYSTFGAIMPGRNFNAGNYRFGFQSQESDDEIKGVGNSINYKYRMHDPRLGRFMSIDPIASKFPHNSPYAFSENRVIDGIEFEGLEVVLLGKQESAGIVVSGNAEVGIAITPDGIYGYGSAALGIETNISVATQISVTFYPTMKAARDAEGFGFDGGVAAGEGLVGSLNASYSNGYWGVNATLGIGGSAILFDVSAYATYTKLKPISEVAKKSEALLLLNESKGVVSGRLSDLNKQRTKMMDSDNFDQQTLKNLNSEINNMQTILNQVDRGIKQVEAMPDENDQ